MESLVEFVIATLGVCCLVWSVISYFRISRFLSQCIETRGEVIRLERSGSGGGLGSYEYAPVFQFRTASGESITVTSDVASSPPGFSEGQAVRVRYDPTNPSDAKIHSFFQTWGGCVIPAWVGIIFLVVTAFKLHWFDAWQ
ncbi:MAG: DUF3592 domain-containing protein [Terracidiphilus sp.]|jgi:hypothetical protein